MEKKVVMEEKKMMSDEFLMYRGKDMFTPTEPYLNSDLYEEEPENTSTSKNQNRNPAYQLKRGQKIKAVPASRVQNVLVKT